MRSASPVAALVVTACFAGALVNVPSYAQRTGLGTGATVLRADELKEARSLLRAGDLQAALSETERVIAARPTDPEPVFLKGVILSEQNRADEAISVFTSLTQSYPEMPEPHNNLAVLYAAKGEYGKARLALESAIRANPGYATAHENLGDVYAALAARAYARAAELDPKRSSVKPKLALARELAGTGATPKARQ